MSWLPAAGILAIIVFLLIVWFVWKLIKLMIVLILIIVLASVLWFLTPVNEIIPWLIQLVI